MQKITSKTEEDFKKQLREDDIDYIRSNLVAKKTIEFLMENAKLVIKLLFKWEKIKKI